MIAGGKTEIVHSGDAGSNAGGPGGTSSTSNSSTRVDAGPDDDFSDFASPEQPAVGIHDRHLRPRGEADGARLAHAPSSGLEAIWCEASVMPYASPRSDKLTHCKDECLSATKAPEKVCVQNLVLSEKLGLSTSRQFCSDLCGELVGRLARDRLTYCKDECVSVTAPEPVCSLLRFFCVYFAQALFGSGSANTL